jgi:predicted phage baseplate assembly protein
MAGRTALPTPRLDDRRFQDLVDDAKRLVMRRCPEWTDHNVSDPGVTLIETFAFMTDQLLYRLNRVPDRLYVKFLELIGLRLLPPTAARTPVTFWLSTPAGSPFTIAAGTELTTVRTEQEEPVVFSTLDDLVVVPCSLAALATEAAGIDDPVDRTQQLEFERPVEAFSPQPLPGDALLIGLDAPVPGCAVRLDVHSQSEGVGVNPRHPPLVWEAGSENGWLPCEVDRDDTGGFNRAGPVVLHVPPAHEVTVVGGRAAGWLRARVVPPDEGQPPYSQSPIVRGLTACTIGGTVTAINAEIVDQEVLGESEGVAGQRFGLLRAPVLAGVDRPTVEVSSDDGWREWSPVEHFAESGPDDQHFVLDAFSGELAFGPVVREPDGTVRHCGAVPEKGAVVRIRRYAVGGGARGNVAAGAIVALRSSIPFVAGVQNREPAQGGVDGESLEEAKARGPLLLRTRSRAVSVEDYEILAREAAPEVARVRCVPADGQAVPAGAVKILVVPAASSDRGRVRLEDLIPAEETLARIADRLEQTRVVGTRVHIEPPRYMGVTVVARLVARPRVDVDRVREQAQDALYRLLSPLPGGGPSGGGWPFGRPVQPGELFAALQGVRGVELVEDLRIFGADPVSGRRGGEVRRLDVDAHSLVFSFEHHVRVEAR